MLVLKLITEIFKSSMVVAFYLIAFNIKTMRQIKITKQITVRENQSIEKYLAEINKIDLISAAEEVELANEYEKIMIKKPKVN